MMYLEHVIYLGTSGHLNLLLFVVRFHVVLNQRYNTEFLSGNEIEEKPYSLMLMKF